MALTDEEFSNLVHLLMRYAEEDMDQWAAWRWTSPYGPMFMRLTMALPEGESPDVYQPMDQFRPNAG